MSGARQYLVYVDGFLDAHLVAAPTASAARYASFRAYEAAGYGRFSWSPMSKHDRFVAFSRQVRAVRPAPTPGHRIHGVADVREAVHGR